MDSAILADEAQRLHAAGQVSRSIDLVFEAIDQMCREEKWQEVDAILKAIDVSKYDLDITISFLTMTCKASKHLPSRQAYLERVMAHANLIGENEEGLFAGLSPE